MKRYLLFLLLFLSALHPLFSQTEATTKDGRKVVLYPDHTWQFVCEAASNAIRNLNTIPFEIPETHPGEEIIKHAAYTLSWNKQHHEANWVAYQLTADKTRSAVTRTNQFKPDPAVLSGTANDLDYLRSGYDRGHLAPAADMGWSATTMKESFYYSNMSPQLPGFNRGIWKKLEEKVRDWAIENKSIYLVTGPVLTRGLPAIGPDKVSVPQYFYKVVLDGQQPEIKGIAFILPNAASSLPLQWYAVTIDSVEHLTGLNFFPELTPAEEKTVESTINLKAWSWESTASGRLINPKTPSRVREIPEDRTAQPTGKD